VVRSLFVWHVLFGLFFESRGERERERKKEREKIEREKIERER
jgi:hypothetical protein